jgi:hypothetical protein
MDAGWKMKNVIYEIIAIHESESRDRKTPTTYTVTQEVNGFALFYKSASCELKVIDFDPCYSYALIEKAVDLGRRERAVHGSKEWEDLSADEEQADNR